MADAKATTPAAPRWPGESRAACAFTFDMDAETLWMARDIHEPVTLSQGRFGPVEALPRILALLEKAEVRASFFIPAWVASSTVSPSGSSSIPATTRERWKRRWAPKGARRSRSS